jgi:thiosulfate/3-mercaptopyruvate sulfurtransferase
MRTIAAVLVASLGVASAAPAQTAQPAHPEYLVSTSWLAGHLGSSGVVVLQVGHTDEPYRAGHVPGARFLPLSAVATAVGGVANEFPPPEQLAATFRALGVGERTPIVIYGDDPGMLAARVWVALDLLGQGERAAILDGGFARWTAEHRPVETEVRAHEPRPFEGRWRAGGVVTADWVRAHLGDSAVLLVDARPAAQWAGTAGDARSGHLPGAKSVYWMNALVAEGDPVLKPVSVLVGELWGPAGALRPGVRTVVTYCRTGMQASHDYFLARYLGLPDVRLYDGSMSEWSQLGYPVERFAP